MIPHDSCRTALLEGEHREDVHRHLETCEGCRDLAHRLAVIERHAARLISESPPGLADRLIAATVAPSSALGEELDGPQEAEQVTEPTTPGRTSRRAIWLTGLSVAASIALVAGVVSRLPEPEPTAEIVPILNSEGIDPQDATLAYEVVKETLDAEGNAIGEPEVTTKLVIPEGRRRVADGVERTVMSGDARIVSRWQVDGIYTTFARCPYDTPHQDVRFPLQVETYPDYRGAMVCDNQDPFGFVVRKSVTGQERIEAAGREWNTWRMSQEVVFDSAPERSFLGTSWFAPALGTYVRIIFSGIDKDGAHLRVTETLKEVREEVPDLRASQPDLDRTGPEVEIVDGTARGHAWRLLAWAATDGICYKLEIGSSSGSSCAETEPKYQMDISASWADDPDRKPDEPTEFGEQRPYAPSIVVYGVASHRTTNIEVRFDDGGPPVTTPALEHEAFAYRFYAIELPVGRQPTAVVALSADGKELQSQSHPSTWDVFQAKRNSPVKLVGKGTLHGIEWELRAHTTDRGDLCTSFRRGQRSGGGGGCGPRPPGERSIWFPGSSFGSGDRFVWYQGEVSLGAAKVVGEVESGPDVSVTPFGADAGFGVAFYLFGVPQDQTLRAVIAYDAEGRELERANNLYGGRP